MMWMVFVAATSAQPAMCVKSPYGIGPRDKKPFICSRAFESSTAAGATTAQKAGGPSLNWPGRKVSFKLNTIGTRDISGQQELAVIRQAFTTWTMITGADFSFVDAGTTSNDRVGFDFRNLDQNDNIVIFQLDWSHDSQIIGLTTATFNAQTGEIFDADIELNDSYYDFTVGDDNVETDLLNTVTHEVGHVVGFDHTDKDGSTIDPDCADTATMSKTSSIGEISKRVLAPSDELGMKFVYPKGSTTNGFCNPPIVDTSAPPVIKQISASVDGSCAAAKPASFALLLVALIFGKRRRWSR